MSLLGLIIGGNAHSQGQTTNIRIAFNGFGGTAALYLGQDAGIFKKHNLTLEMILFPAGLCRCKRSSARASIFC